MVTSAATVASDLPGSAERRPRKSLVALRVFALLHVAAVVAQPVLAGLYLSGDIDAVAVHEANAHVVTTVALGQGIVAICYTAGGGGRWWPIWFSFTWMLLEETQKVFGYVKQLGLHIPFGVFIVSTVVLFAVWTFTASARKPRRRRAAR